MYCQQAAGLAAFAAPSAHTGGTDRVAQQLRVGARDAASWGAPAGVWGPQLPRGRADLARAGNAAGVWCACCARATVQRAVGAAGRRCARLCAAAAAAIPAAAAAVAAAAAAGYVRGGQHARRVGRRAVGRRRAARSWQPCRARAQRRARRGRRRSERKRRACERCGVRRGTLWQDAAHLCQPDRVRAQAQPHPQVSMFTQ